MKAKLSILLAILTFLAMGCGKKSDATPPAPGAATLSFPAQNSACTTGTVISATQSSITFTWNSASNADSYELSYRNLLTGLSAVQTTTSNQLTVTLLRNTPYSWFVVSESSKTSATTQSSTWKFYNAGAGTVSHPPFPADNLVPTEGQSVTTTTGSVSLSWTGSDPDNDIAGYDVYFGTTATPPVLTNTTSTSVNIVAVTSGSTYYWRVVTKDAAGNTSDSGLFQFTVN
jgi:hypothetical protein